MQIISYMDIKAQYYIQAYGYVIVEDEGMDDFVGDMDE